jgi:prepilin-type processing-associated H-X9-DG protein
MAGIINSIANAWFDWQSSMLWQTAVLIGVVAGIDRLIRKRAWPQLRYMLWLLVFVKLVLPPGLTSPWSVTSQVPALAQQAVEAGMQNPRPPAVVPAAQPLPVEPAAATATGTPSNAEPLAAALPRAESAVSQPPAQAKSESLSWTAYAMAVWLVGVVTLASGLHIRLRRLSQEHGGSRPADVPSWFDELLTQTAKEMGLRRTPRVVFSERVCCPAVFGVFRPILLFPADRLPITRQETRHILLHEMAHIKRGDLLVHAAYMVLATIYWFNPLLWLIRKHVQNLRELCCDATVAAHLREETAGYRETLLAAGRALLAQPVDPGLGLLGLFENSGWLPVRLQWLQKKTWRYPWLRRASVAAVAILMFCCILPMASIDAAAQKPSDQEFKVTLPCGATVELVGIRKADTDHWWRPDGSPLDEAPYDTCSGSVGSQNLYEYAVRYTNLPEGVTGVVRVDPSGSGCGGNIPDGMCEKAGRPVENIAGLVFEQDPATERVTVKVYLSTGSWVCEKAEILRREESGQWNSDTYFSSTLDAVVGCAVPSEDEGCVYAPLFYAGGDPHERMYDARLIAVDVNNVEHSPAGFSHGCNTSFHQSANRALVSLQAGFALRLKDIHHFDLQTRSLTWIEFKNVSLRPGETQKVEIVTTTPDGSVVVERQSTASKISAAALDEKSVDPEFKVTLPNGITVELVGVRKPETNQWWRPDGTPLADAPYDSSEGDPQHQNPYEFAVHFENLPEGMTGGIRVDSRGGGCGGAIPETMDKLKPHKAGKPVENMAYTVVDQDPKTETVTVRVDLATGEWATEESEMLCQGSSGGWGSHKYFSPTLDAVVGSAIPYEQNGRVYAALFYASGDPTEQKNDARLIAVDFNGVEYAPVDGGNGGWFFNRVRDKALANSEWEFDLHLKDIHCFNLQTRSHTWIEFKNVSLRPGETQKVEIVTTTPDGSIVVERQSTASKISATTADEKSANPEFKVALPGGGTIELIGAHKAGTDQWWRPDGSPLAEAPYDSSEEADHTDGYEIALRYENLPKGSSGGIDVEGGDWGGTIPMWYAELQKAGKPVEGISYVVASPPQGTEMTCVRVYLATGEWKIDSIYPRNGSGWNARTSGSHAVGSVIYSAPYERENKTYVTATYSAIERNKCDIRLVALDAYNVEHLSDDPGGLWTSAGFAQITPDFNLPLDDVAAFYLQTRPYTRIEFRNVTLRPGELHKVEIVTTEPGRSVAAKDKPGVPEGFSSFRECSSQMLQAFHIACVSYLGEHRTSELPYRPWDLKFQFPKPVLANGRYENMGIMPLQYVASAGYFRSGGYPALKRKDFESNEASRTPILYCKTLLEREDGKGTNVLYGDGHIEYVTTDQLDRLKAATPSGR